MSGECLYDVQMNDRAPIGGLSNHSVTQATEQMCPGEKVYVEGPIISGSMAPEGMINATVVGTGYYSGQTVTDEDPAVVEVYKEVITLPPTPAPTNCPINMGFEDTTIYPDEDVVATLGIKADNNRASILPLSFMTCSLGELRLLPRCPSKF
jgi:hypothetical protein